MSTTSTLNSILAATSGSDSSQIDVTSAVNAILYADRAPERAWQAQQTTLAAQTTAINQLQTESSTLTESLYTLQDATGALDSVTATSSSAGVFTATAVAGTAAGNHTVIVNQLATTGSAYSSTVASSSTQLASGSFTLTVGSGNAVAINTGSGDGTDDTLDELAGTINGESLGVNASVVTDSTGSRLALVAKASGTAADFTLSNESGLTFTQPAAAVDASLTVDGVPIDSSSNTVSGAISGVTLNLLSQAQGVTQNLTIAPDTATITSAVSAFVTAYNTLITDVNSQFDYNSSTQTGGALAGDSTIQAFQSDLLSSTNYAASSGALKSLTSLGITTNADGTLTLDSDTLTSAVTTNLNAVTSFFQGSDANGFVASLESSLNTYTNPSQGAFTVDLSSISNENTDLTGQTTSLELYLSTLQTTLTTQYNNADIALSQLPQTLKQIDALLNPPSSSDS